MNATQATRKARHPALPLRPRRSSVGQQCMHPKAPLGHLSLLPLMWMPNLVPPLTEFVE